jgi:hypothetical protein
MNLIIKGVYFIFKKFILDLCAGDRGREGVCSRERGREGLCVCVVRPAEIEGGEGVCSKEMLKLLISSM